MNIKCSFCQTPFTLSRVEMLDALQEMDAGKLSHYDAHCPRCRRATPIQRKRMEIFFPNWHDALKQFEAEMKAHPQQAALLSKPESVTDSPTESTPEPVPPKSKAERDTKAKPPPRQQVGQKPAARSERGRKPPAKNTPSQGKNKNK